MNTVAPTTADFLLAIDAIVSAMRLPLEGDELAYALGDVIDMFAARTTSDRILRIAERAVSDLVYYADNYDPTPE